MHSGAAHNSADTRHRADGGLSPPADATPPRRNLSRPETWLLWFLAGVTLAAVVTWIAFSLQQQGFAPAVLFPLAVGGALGAGLAAVRNRLDAPSPRATVMAAIVWGLLVVVGQDYVGHRRRTQVLEQQLSAHGPVGMLAASQADELQPRFKDHLAAVVRRQPVWWALELALTSGAAGLVAAWLARRESAHRSLHV
ncbi:MAG: hypothetical protein AB7O59_00365 [Pirellulales bacterium]